MIHHTSIPAVGIFLFFLAVVLGISFYLGSKAKSAKGYYAAHGSVHWFVNGIAFAGDYLSAASFLGICGMIAFFGYDGFLYAIGFLAGWVVALFVIAEPLKKLGKFTFADALDSRFHSRGIKLSAAVSTLVVSIFYLIPQMVGAGALIKPLLGLPYWAGVLLVGVTVILIVVTAGMVSTTWVQFIKGSLLVLFCFALTLMILNRGLRKDLGGPNVPQHAFGAVPESFITKVGDEIVPPDGGWVGKPYLRIRDYRGVVTTWRKGWKDAPDLVSRAQTITETPQGKIVNGRPQGGAEGQGDLYPVGTIAELPGGPTQTETGPVSPAEFLSKLSDSEIITWPSEKITNADGTITTIYYQTPRAGAELLTPGGSPTFKGVRSQKLTDKLDFLSLMLALFCGTASLPHILIRYYTVKDQAAARKSTVVGIASIGLFYILTLYLGLGAMISGTLDPTDNNMAAPLLAKSFGETPFALISAIAFTTVL
ncbi:MAG: solute symporter family protein, partial [Tepidisphaeraceae bacterium]